MLKLYTYYKSYTQHRKKVYTFRFIEYSEGSGPDLGVVGLL